MLRKKQTDKQTNKQTPRTSYSWYGDYDCLVQYSTAAAAKQILCCQCSHNVMLSANIVYRIVLYRISSVPISDINPTILVLFSGLECLNMEILTHFFRFYNLYSAVLTVISLLLSNFTLSMFRTK